MNKFYVKVYDVTLVW